MRVFLIGDCHGNISNIKRLSKMETLTKDDTVIVLGDFGANYYLNKRDDEFKNKVANFECNFFIVRGNHEERPSNIFNEETWHIEDFFKNKVYVENKYPNIKYALDEPAIYMIDYLKVLVIGGAYSVDKYYRLECGYNWFKDEQPTLKEMSLAIDLCYENFWEVDVVLTHTCNESSEPIWLFIPGVDQSKVDKTTEKFLELLFMKLNFKLHFFGHYHDDYIYKQKNTKGKQVMLYKCYTNLFDWIDLLEYR